MRQSYGKVKWLAKKKKNTDGRDEARCWSKAKVFFSCVIDCWLKPGLKGKKMDETACWKAVFIFTPSQLLLKPLNWICWGSRELLMTFFLFFFWAHQLGFVSFLNKQCYGTTTLNSDRKNESNTTSTPRHLPHSSFAGRLCLGGFPCNFSWNLSLPFWCFSTLSW